MSKPHPTITPLLSRRAGLTLMASTAAFGTVVLGAFKPSNAGVTYWLDGIGGLALILTLFVVWWYTDETSALRSEAVASRLDANRREEAQFQALVVIRRLQDSKGGWTYVLSNLGPGIARRCFYVSGTSDARSLASPQATFCALSSVAPGDSWELPAKIREPLNEDGNAFAFGRKHFIVSEGLDGRWYLTTNVVQSTREVASQWEPLPVLPAALASRIDKATTPLVEQLQQALKE